MVQKSTTSDNHSNDSAQMILELRLKEQGTGDRPTNASNLQLLPENENAGVVWKKFVGGRVAVE